MQNQELKFYTAVDAAKEKNISLTHFERKEGM